VYYTPKTTSTMDLAKSLLSFHPEGGYVVWAGQQSQGRGRFSSRRWESPPKESLLFTLVIPWTLESHRPPSLMAALALSRTLETHGLKPRIKWPNDLLLPSPATPVSRDRENKKVSGILAAYSSGYLHLGIGINLLQTFFPPELTSKATSLALSGLTIKPEGLLLQILQHLLEDFSRDALPLEEINQRLWGRDRWTEWSLGLGDEVLVGRVLGVDEEGQLLLRCRGRETEIRRICAGEGSSQGP
jgi:BirA family biotin operon repressor/biotin-[acetyl-CoA-carboxylase] ligase